MPVLIVRPESGPRVFPPVAGGGDDLCARRATELSLTPLGRMKRMGWGLGVAERVPRLFVLRRLALENEAAGRFNRADLFWHELRTALIALPANHPAWAPLAGELNLEPAELRRRFITEQVIDAHAALFNGRCTGDEPPPIDDRAYAQVRHLGNACRLLGDELSATDRKVLLGTAALAQIAAEEKAGRWDAAIGQARRLAELYPEDRAIVERVPSLIFAAGLAEAPAIQIEYTCRHQATLLQKRIDALEAFRAANPDCIGAYEVLAHLHHLQAIKLANGDRPSQALLAVEKALAFKPGFDDAIQSRTKIEEMLANVTRQLQQLQGQLGSTFNAGQMVTRTLSVEGLALQAEASAGSGPRNKFAASGEPEQLAQARRRASLRDLWKRAGFAIPAENWDERTRAFDQATDIVLARRPESQADVLQGWLDTAERYPELRLHEFELDKVVACFARGFKAEEPPATLEAPAIPTPAAVAGDDRIPAEYWFFSKRDFALKLMAIASVALLAIGGLSMLTYRANLRERSEAFAQVQAAAEKRDEQAFADAAARFRSAVGVKYDGRLSSIETVEKESKKWPVERARDAAHTAFTNALQSGDDTAVLVAAEQFLETSPNPLVDLRTERVRTIYVTTFTRWFARELNADARRVERFTALSRQ